jgi:5-amino-6-(5-phosphoribosylamino)uracil reductase/diaminohydroxyphosphoribosylaminopyrimidine deaminase/5-amino-6-(5-phosphoribosylamino)uracil reductase
MMAAVNGAAPDHRELLATPRPFVTVSYAQTIDGRLATSTGSSRWISGDDALRFSHELRASHDGIMVGVGTVRKDDPRLTVRHVPGKDPLRIIADSSLRTPLDAHVLANGAAAGTVLAVIDRAAPERREQVTALGATVLQFNRDEEGRVDLVELLAALHERGLRSVMVEGGARLITSLLRLQAVDRLAVCVAPKVLGSGLDAIGDLGICDLAHAISLKDQTYTRYGSDIIIDGRVTFQRSPNGR